MGLRVKITSEETPVRIATICDSPDPLPVFGFTLNNKRLVRMQELFRADYSVVFNQKNRRTQIGFTVTRNTDGSDEEFPNSVESLLFAMDHLDAVPNVGLVEFALSEGATTATRWLARGGIEDVELVRHRGASILLRYSIVGGQLLKANPHT